MEYHEEQFKTFSEVEELFASQVVTICDWGFPLDKLDIRMMVAAYLTKQK